MTDDWVTVIRIPLIQDAYLVRSQLELEGLSVRILDENTTQIAPHFSIASGGARIQVPEKDKEVALQLLRTWNYLAAQEDHKETLLDKFGALTSKISIIKHWRVEARVLFVIAIVLGSIIIPLGISGVTEPTIVNRIDDSHWCVASVKHNGLEVLPEPKDLVISLNGCEDRLSMKNDEIVYLPSFGGSSVRANCTLTESKIQFEALPPFIDNSDGNLFKGTFKYRLNEDGTLDLISINRLTEIHLVSF